MTYISRQLGHSDQKSTERYNAKWIPNGDEFRAPMELNPGKLPADLLVRLAGTYLAGTCPHAPMHGATLQGLAHPTAEPLR